MSDKKVRLIVSMPGKTVMDEDVDNVILTTIFGDMAILPDHEPVSAALVDGMIRVRRGGESVAALSVMGGYATFRDGVVNIVSPVADTPDRIAQAVEAIFKEREQNKLYELNANIDVSRAEIALKNILIRRGDSAISAIKGQLGDDPGAGMGGGGSGNGGGGS